MVIKIFKNKINKFWSVSTKIAPKIDFYPLKLILKSEIFRKKLKNGIFAENIKCVYVTIF